MSGTRIPGITNAELAGLVIPEMSVLGPVFAGGSTSTSRPLLKSQTWTNVSESYRGLVLDITDTASASSSLLAEMKVGGSSRFVVDKGGSLGIGGVTSPLARIHAEGPNTVVALMRTTNDPAYQGGLQVNWNYSEPFFVHGHQGYRVIGQRNGSQTVLYSGDAERLRLDDSGNALFNWNATFGGVQAAHANNGTRSHSFGHFVDGVFTGLRVTQSWDGTFNDGYVSIHTVDGGVAGGEKIRITPAGFFGIGTPNPTGELHVYKASGEARIFAQSLSGATGSDYAIVKAYGGVYETSLIQYNAGTAYLYSNATALYVGTAAGSAPLVFMTNDAERVRLTPSGEMLIGSASSLYSSSGRGVLEINGSSSSLLALKNNGGVGSHFMQAGVDAQIINQANGYIAFGTNNVERARLDRFGSFGVGLSDPATYGKLVVYTAAATGTTALRIVGYASNLIVDYLGGGNSYLDGAGSLLIRDQAGGVTRFTVDTQSNAVVGNIGAAASSQRNLVLENGQAPSAVPSNAVQLFSASGVLNYTDGAGRRHVVDGWKHSGRDFPLGTLITTSIDYGVTTGDPWVLEIRGNSYNTSAPFDIQVQGYIYDNTIINTAGLSNGRPLTDLVALNVGGKLCFWFSSQGYWHGYSVKAYTAYEGVNHNKVESITNEAKPAGTKEVNLMTNMRQSLHSLNFDLYAPTLTGSGASGTWGINITGSAASAAVAGSATTAGSAASATVADRWSAARTISLSGDVTGSQSVDGSANASIAATIGTGAVNTTKMGGDVTAVGKALLTAADATAQRSALGLGTAATSAAGAFATAVHSHLIADVTGLQTAIDSKLDDSQATAAGLTLLGAADASAQRTALGLGSAAQSATTAFAAASHAHVISDVTGLQTALDNKLDDSQATAAGLAVLGAANAAAQRTALGVVALGAVTNAAAVSATHQIEVEIGGITFYMLAKIKPPQTAWPTSQTFTPNASVVSNALSMPALRTPVNDPTFPQTKIKRISDASELTSLSDAFNNFGPWYGNRQHWNSNNSKYIVTAYRTGADGNYTTPYGRNYWLFNDSDDTPIHVLNNGTRSVSNQWRWSNTNPDELIFVEWSGTQTALEAMDVNTRAITTIKNFSPTYDLLSHDFCGGVGDPSIDGRYWALGVRKTGGAWFVICWDRVADTILCEIPVPVQPGTSYLPQVTMSKSGAYITIWGTTAWTSGSTSVGRGVAVFNRSGVYLRSINQTGGSGATDIVGDHNSLGTDVNGNDIVIFFHDDGVGRAFCSFPLGQDQSGSPTRHTPYGMILGNMYCTPYTFGVNGQFLISDYPVTTGNSARNAFPLRNHSWIAYADGSQVVYPICESRYSMSDFTLDFNYLQFPWTTPNRTGTKYMFKSSMDTNWSAGSGGVPSVFHAFIASAA